jgi:CSLREA domain-containing protein
MPRAFRLSLLAVSLLCLCSLSFAANYVVTKTADTNDGTCDADCSLREAVVAANGTSENDTISFSGLFSAPQTITLSGTDIIITNNGTLAINGPGSEKLTVNGNNASRVFSNNTGSVATIRNLRVTGGNGSSTVTSGRGGGVYNSGGMLTLENLVITGNTAANGGGTNNAGTATMTIIGCAIFSNSVTGSGGAAQNFAGNTLNIRNSSIYNNTSNSTTTGGGGIQANGTLNIANTTFANNNALGGNGGAITFNGTLLNLNNVTIAGNTATVSGGGIHRTGANPLNMRNTIIANNTGAATPDFNGSVNSQGNNIIGNVATSTGWIASDLQNTDPKLAPLGFNGNPGLSYLLAVGSPAINGGQSCVIDLTCATGNPVVALNTDQRGATRFGGSNGADIGAIEAGAFFAVTPFGRINQSYSFTLVPNRGNFTYSLSAGNLPPGMSVNFSQAQRKSAELGAQSVDLTGTPTQTGTYSFTLTGVDGSATVLASYTLYVLTTQPTVRVTGQVVFLSGNPVRGAQVTFTNEAGESFTVRTNGLGRFIADGILVGAYYSVNINSKVTSGGISRIVFPDSSHIIFQQPDK